MDTANRQSLDERSRLWELIRGCLKIEAYVVILTLFALWITWSAVEVGRQRVASIDVASNAARLAWYSRWYSKLNPGSTNTPVLKTLSAVAPSDAQFVDQLEVNLFRSLLAILGNDQQLSKAAEVLESRVNEIENFAQKRRDAYRIDFVLPYLRRTLTINAIDLANSVPFIMIGMLTTLFILRLRQRVYEVVLAFLNASEKDPSKLAKMQVLTGFRAGKLTRHEPRGGGGVVWVYRRPFGVFPEGLGLCATVVAVAYGSWTLLPSSSLATDPTYSMFFNFYGVLFTAIWLALFLLRRTWMYHQARMSDVTGAPVKSYVAYQVSQLVESVSIRSGWVPRYARLTRGLLLAFVGIAAFASLFSPWAEPNLARVKPFRGFDFLRSQQPLRIGTLGGKSYSFFPLEPHVFTEMRVVLIISIIFLILCVAVGSRLLVTKARDARLWAAQKYFALAVLLLAGYVFFYLIGLDYVQAPSAQASQMFAMDFIPPPLGGPLFFRGYPLVFYNPLPAFWIYFASCVAMALIGFSVGGKDKDVVS